MENKQVIFRTLGCKHISKGEWDSILSDLLRGNPVTCEFCLNKFDFSGIKKYLEGKSVSIIGSVGLLGLDSSISGEKISPDKMLTLHAKDMGIPENARIVEVICVANGDGRLRPLYEPPQALNHRRTPKQFNFHPIRTQSDCKETTIAISITWVNDPEQDILYQAYKNYIEEDYNYSVVPLNVYIETLCRKFYRKNYRPKDNKYKHVTFLNKHLKNEASAFPEINQQIVSEVIENLTSLSLIRDDLGHDLELQIKHNNTVSENIGNWFSSVIIFRRLLSILTPQQKISRNS